MFLTAFQVHVLGHLDAMVHGNSGQIVLKWDFVGNATDS